VQANPTLDYIHLPAKVAGLTPCTAIPRKVVAATVIGNALEFYDFVTYAFFAVYIGKAFFPASTELGSLLLSVAVFGVGFVSRPLGVASRPCCSPLA
jgi:hypothetical protein